MRSSQREEHPDDKTCSTQMPWLLVRKVALVLALVGGVFRVLLKDDDKANFVVYSGQPFFQVTTVWSTIEGKVVRRFDPMMLYAARMSRAVHMAFYCAPLICTKVPGIVELVSLDSRHNTLPSWIVAPMGITT